MTDDNALIAAFIDHQGAKDAVRKPGDAGSSSSIPVSAQPSLTLPGIAVPLLLCGLNTLSTGAITFFLRFSNDG